MFDFRSSDDLLYHIDHQDSLKLNIGDEISFSHNIPNYGLQQFEYFYCDFIGQLIKNDASKEEELESSKKNLLRILKSFKYPDGQYIENIVQKWAPEQLSLLDENDDLIHGFKKNRIEIIFENVRQNLFKDEISRYSGFFLTEKPNEWISFTSKQKQGSLYGFEIENAIVRSYDSNWLDLSFNENDFLIVNENARKYWCGANTQKSKVEILSLGTLKVISKEKII